VADKLNVGKDNWLDGAEVRLVKPIRNRWMVRA